jgi:hypothetical protein
MGTPLPVRVSPMLFTQAPGAKGFSRHKLSNEYFYPVDQNSHFLRGLRMKYKNGCLHPDGKVLFLFVF